MAPIRDASSSLHTLADLLEHLGGIAPDRVRFQPFPGTATETDILGIQAREGKLCELVERVLVEKAMGFRESCLAVALLVALQQFVRSRNLGLVTAPDGLMRLASDLVRIPDVAFVSWSRIPERRMPTEAIPHLIPNLVIEVLSPSNTPGEMMRKRREYFEAGVQLMWQVDPDTRSVEVYTDVERVTTLREADTLDGGLVLPEFTLSLRDLFAELDVEA